MSASSRRILGAHLRECRDCGLFSQVTPAGAGHDAHCPRCGYLLRRWRRDSLNRTLACAIAGLCFYGTALITPFLGVETFGRSRASTLFTGPYVLEHHGLWALALVVLATSILLPLVNLVLLLTVLIGLRLPCPPEWIHRALSWFGTLRPWAMIDVYLIGLFIAYTRLTGMVHVDLGPAVYALIGLMLSLVAADAAFDPDAAWNALERRGLTAGGTQGKEAAADTVQPRLIGCDNCRKVTEARPGEPCARCGKVLRPRTRNSLAYSWALIGAAVILYVPANIYPVMEIVRLGFPRAYTILGGVEELIGAGLWPLALIVFAASIAVPVLKLLSLILMLAGVHRRSRRRLLDRTRLYRGIGVIGRWSMIDVFVVSILVALMRFGILVHVSADMGAVYFAAVVMLTMLATEAFDPRLMWDVVEADRALEPGPANLATIECRRA